MGKQRSKDRAAEFNEALKLEMARKAESEEELVRMQFEEQEKQWQKRYAQWEIEEMARRNLLEEVYADRARQVEIKQEARQAMIADRLSERNLLIEENSRLEAMEAEKQHQMGVDIFTKRAEVAKRRGLTAPWEK